MDLDYERDIAIDHQALDVEWVRQPDLMRRYSEHAALAKKRADELKEQLEVIRAQLDREVRSNPAAFGLDKVTESAIQSTILLQEEYQRASQELIDARYESEIAAAAVRALDQKKTALENLVKLMAAAYFAGPATPRDLSQEWIKHQSNVQANRRIRLSVRARETSE